MTRVDGEVVTALVGRLVDMAGRFHDHHELIVSTSTVLRALLDAPMVYSEVQLSEMVRWGARTMEALKDEQAIEARNARRMVGMMAVLAAEVLAWRTPAGIRPS